MTQTTDTSSMQEQIEEAVNAFKKEFTKTRAGEIVWLRGIMPGEIEKFLTKQFSTIATKSAEAVQAKRIEIKQIVGTNAVFLLPSKTERVEGFYKNNEYRVKGIDVTKDIQEALSQKERQ